MPDLTSQQLTAAVAGAAALALLCLIVTLVLAARLRRLRRQYRLLRGAGAHGDLLETIHRWQQRLDGAESRIEGMATALDHQAERGRSALQRFGMVRFDAFEDMGGRLSFSAAFLDDHGNGMVITSINGRTETRTYAKSIEGLSSEHHLSDEERDAINHALSAKGRVIEDRPAVSR